MAGYGYFTDNGNGKANGRRLTRFQSWGMCNDGVEAKDGWSSSTLHAQADQVRPDHVCRPVIVGSDGKVMPGVLDCPPQYKKNGIASDYYPNTGGSVDDFISSVQELAVNGNKVSLPGGKFDRWREENGSYENGAHDKNSSTVWSKPVTNNGGWGWSAPQKAQLGRATNNVETAAEFLRESAKPAIMSVVHSNPWTTPSYASKPWSTQSYQPYKKDSSTSIDSRAAAKKYGGQFIW